MVREIFKYSEKIFIQRWFIIICGTYKKTIYKKLKFTLFMGWATTLKSEGLFPFLSEEILEDN